MHLLTQEMVYLVVNYPRQHWAAFVRRGRLQRVLSLNRARCRLTRSF